MAEPNRVYDIRICATDNNEPHYSLEELTAEVRRVVGRELMLRLDKVEVVPWFEEQKQDGID